MASPLKKIGSSGSGAGSGALDALTTVTGPIGQAVKLGVDVVGGVIKGKGISQLLRDGIKDGTGLAITGAITLATGGVGAAASGALVGKLGGKIGEGLAKVGLDDVASKVGSSAAGKVAGDVAKKVVSDPKKVHLAAAGAGAVGRMAVNHPTEDAKAAETVADASATPVSDAFKNLG